MKAAKGIITKEKPGAAKASEPEATEGGGGVLAQVGKPAPDFEASAFVNGGFKNVKLSDYKGKWVVLCFYPGDFTFV
ncbi:MAG: redoxin domain-containing protein [Actinobacteria bacterium]|nr:redoxin domain-containing protein [Actinomycetota bacterium]